MKKAIFYKEWIKTHRYFWLALIVSLLFVAYAILQLQRVINFKEVGHLWEILLSRDTVFIEILTYLPLCTVYPRDATETTQTDPAPPLSRTQNDLSDAAGRSAPDSFDLRAEPCPAGCIPAEYPRTRTLGTHHAYGHAVVYSRHRILSADGMDMPRTHLETTHRQSADRNGPHPDLLSVRRAPILRLLLTLAVAVHHCDRTVRTALRRPVQGRLSRLIAHILITKS